MNRTLMLLLLLLVPRLPAADPPEFKSASILNTEGKETGIALRFDPDALRVMRKNEPVKTIPYGEITQMTYAFSKAPRWKTATGLAVTGVGLLVAPIFLAMKGKKHWLSVVSEKDSAVFHLDKKNYMVILGAIESKTGKTVERQADTID